MIWTGLTGGIGTGKSTVTRFLRSWNIPVVCADELAREVVQKGTSGRREVMELFGADALDEKGQLNRKAIGKKVFADKSLLKALEDIIHPRVRVLSVERKEELKKKSALLAFYDVPLLFEKEMEHLFDKIVVVHCEPALQRERLIMRDGFSPEEADRRIATQWPLLDKIKRAHLLVDNNGLLSDLEKNVRILISQLLP